MKQLLQYISILRETIITGCFLILITATGCRKYLEVPVPTNKIVGTTAFDNDATAAGVLNTVYEKLSNGSYFDGNTSVGFFTGLYGDELQNYSILGSYQAVYSNTVSSTVGGVSGLWSNLYTQLYPVNVAIEELTPVNKALNYQKQWLGEAYFLRGLIYFYITNMYGEAPLVLSSDYTVNNRLARSPQADVYQQIVSDLKQAQSLLTPEFRDAAGLVTKDRGRPNQAAATALLARVYLYMNDWQNAAAQAGNVIANAAAFQLVKPAQTFLVNSTENIWGLVPFNNNTSPYKVRDVIVYILPKGVSPIKAGLFATLSDSLVKSFEPNDLRFTNWVGIDTVPASGTTPLAVYYYPYKYKANGTGYTAAQETLVMLRLAEQYLIRAEARAQQNDLTGAVADLNAIRTRAGLPATTAVSQTEILSAILKERRIEFFTEAGHRFFDLRRTKALDALMTKLSPLKGGTWEPFEQWWPIPLTDIQNNPRLIQTSGYQ